MEVELFLGIVAPRKSIVVVDDPEEGETQGAQKQNTGQNYNQGVFQPTPTTPLVLVFVMPMSATTKEQSKKYLVW